MRGFQAIGEAHPRNEDLREGKDRKIEVERHAHYSL
jgi:hypothetical protein